MKFYLLSPLESMFRLFLMDLRWALELVGNFFNQPPPEQPNFPLGVKSR